MARKKTRSHAERLRRYTDESNAIHEQYLADPQLLREYEYFVAWQTAYMMPYYSEFEANRETATAVEFVFSDLVGAGISARDADLARVIPVMIRLLPDKALAALASATKLNARTLEVNLEICRNLFSQYGTSTGISERDYCEVFRQSTIALGHSLERLVRSPLLGMTLRTMHAPAHAAGFGAMQDFLEQGYTTFHAIENVDFFLNRLAVRMTKVFTRICEEPLGGLDSTPTHP